MERGEILGRERTLGIGNISAREIPYYLETKPFLGRNTIEGKILGKGKHKERENYYA